MSRELSQKKCIPCQGGVPPLDLSERLRLLETLKSGWTLIHDNTRIKKSFSFPNYKLAWELVNKISEIAEEENHHPDLKFGWGYLELEIYTHKINSLVESDFIFAAKVDQLAD